MKQMGTLKRSENGREAWVDLCARPIQTDTKVSKYKKSTT
jgi:hypothetical protein